MRRIKEVLRLKYELGLGRRQIARSCSIGQSTVHDYLRRAEAAGLRWPLGEERGDDRIDRELFGKPAQPSEQPLQRTLPDFASIHDQLKQHRHLTLQLLWEEYRQAHPDGYGDSHFCDHYQKWRRRLDVVLRQEQRAGEKVFVDWAGRTIPVHDRLSHFVRRKRPQHAVRSDRELIEVRSTATTVEILHKSQRVASHLRARARPNGNEPGAPPEVASSASGMGT